MGLSAVELKGLVGRHRQTERIEVRGVRGCAGRSRQLRGPHFLRHRGWLAPSRASSSALWDLGELLADSRSSPQFPQEALPSLAPWSLGLGSNSEAGEAPPCRLRSSRPPPGRSARPALPRDLRADSQPAVPSAPTSRGRWAEGPAQTRRCGPSPRCPDPTAGAGDAGRSA